VCANRVCPPTRPIDVSAVKDPTEAGLESDVTPVDASPSYSFGETKLELVAASYANK